MSCLCTFSCIRQWYSWSRFSANNRCSRFSINLRPSMRCLNRDGLQLADIGGGRGVADIIHRKAIKVYGVSIPPFWNIDAYAALLPAGRYAEYPLSKLWAVGVEIHLVVAAGPLAFGVRGEEDDNFTYSAVRPPGVHLP